jgi:hypothetical protein
MKVPPVAIACLCLWPSWAAVTAFTGPLTSSSGSVHRAAPGSSRAGDSRLFLADEIKDYRKGLSQINSKRSGESQQGQQQKKKKNVDCVFKFGGSSLADSERIDHVARLIRDQIEAGFRPRAVVCSAMGKTTNNLLSAGEFALGEYR